MTFIVVAGQYKRQTQARMRAERTELDGKRYLDEAAHQLLRAWALHACIVTPPRPRYLDVLLVRLSGEGLQSLTAGGAAVDEPLKAWLLVERGLSGPAGLVPTLAEFLAYKFVSAVTMVAALGYLLAVVVVSQALLVGARVMFVVGILFLATAAVAIWRRVYLIGALVSGLARLPLVRRWAAVNFNDLVSAKVHIVALFSLFCP